MTYRQALAKEMVKLSKISNSIFLGQQVGVTDFYKTLGKVKRSKRLELPVAEELQMGMSIGLAMKGYLPISVYQRMDFLPRACDQIVNHLNISKHKVIIRTTIGSKTPLDTGYQHSKDLTIPFFHLCRFPVVKLESVHSIKYWYNVARKCNHSIMLIEEQDKYDTT